MNDHQKIPMQDAATENNHPLTDDLEAYQNGALSSEARSAIASHVSTCEVCAGQLAFFELMSAATTDRVRDVGPCPTEEALLGYLEGAGTREHRDAISAHVDRCDSCAGRIAGLARVVRGAEREQAEMPSVQFSARSIPTPDLIRRVRETAETTERDGRIKAPQTRGPSWGVRLAWGGVALAIFAIATVIVLHRPGSNNIAHRTPKRVAPTPVLIPTPKRPENQATNIMPGQTPGKPHTDLRTANRRERTIRRGTAVPPTSHNHALIEKRPVRPTGTDLEKEGLPMPHGPHGADGPGKSSP